MTFRMHRVACLLGTLLVVCACSAPSERLQLPQGAQAIDGAAQLVAKLEALNHGLKAYKGIGRLELDLPSGRYKNRIAWIGSEPENLRVEILIQPGGQPLASIASDGQWLYVIAHQEGRFIKKKAGRSTLEHLVGIPITPRDVYLLLTGRIPILPYDTARLYVIPSSNASMLPGQGRLPQQLILTFKAQTRRYLSQKVYLSGDDVRKVEYFDRSGALLFRTLIPAVKKVGGYSMPTKIFFMDDNQAVVKIMVERSWTDVPVAESVFHLSPPETR